MQNLVKHMFWIAIESLAGQLGSPEFKLTTKTLKTLKNPENLVIAKLFFGFSIKNLESLVKQTCSIWFLIQNNATPGKTQVLNGNCKAQTVYRSIIQSCCEPQARFVSPRLALMWISEPLARRTFQSCCVPQAGFVSHRLALMWISELIVLHYTVLYYTILYYTVLYCLNLAGSEQIVVDLLLNSNKKWKANGVGWLRAGFGWFAIEF